MRIPFTPHGAKEIVFLGGGLLISAIAAGALVHWAAAIPFALLLLFVLNFFRDPERTPPGGPGVAVAPADGKVTDIGEVDEPNFIGGRALRIGIFLDVFSVHVNRAPLDGRITGVLYKPGKFLDVRDPRCKDLNEANLVGFQGPRGKFAIRQVAGLIARRIVWPFKEGDELRRGDRAGMIKFGSRTELFLPADAPVEIEVEVGQNVRGGASVMLRYRDA